jgi:hypothetical protein
MACEHEWVVFSPAIEDRVLMVECASCHAGGVVEDSSPEEWAAAHHAAAVPYRWEHGGRVRPLLDTLGTNVYIQRTSDGYAPSEWWASQQEREKASSGSQGPPPSRQDLHDLPPSLPETPGY